MQSLLFAFFIAFINNIDNIGVRIAYSLRGIKIDIYKNILISIITFIISTLTAFFGSSILNIISPKIYNVFSTIILVSLGLYFIFEPYIKRKKACSLTDIIIDPNNADINNSKNIELNEAIFLGIALNINNIGGSFSAGILGINIYLTGGLSAIISFIALWLGNYLSSLFKSQIMYKRVGLVAGLILIAFGLKQLL